MSYFNHPVKVSVFMAAIPGLVERLLRRVPGGEGRIIVQVIFVGDMACAVWTESGVGAFRMIRGTIKLPALKGGAVIDRAKANRWIGYVIHEVWHMVFTSSPVWSHYAQYNPGIKRAIANALEDARIERSGMELGYAEGFNVVGKDLMQHLLTTGGMNVDPNDPRQVAWAFAVGCRGYGVQGEARLLSRLDPRIAALLKRTKAKVDAIPATILPAEGTKATCDLATWVYSELKKIGKKAAAEEAAEEAAKEEPPICVNPAPVPQRHDANDEPAPEDVDVGEVEAGDATDQTYDDEGAPSEDGGDGDDDGGFGGDAGDDADDGDGGEGDGGEGEGDGDGEGGDAGDGEDHGGTARGGGDTVNPLKVGDDVVCPDGSAGRIVSINEGVAEVVPL